MRLSLSPKHYIANCTGQACLERSECLRYMRLAQFPGLDRATGAVVAQLWASYDIEREATGCCPAKIEPHRGAVMAQALLRAA